VCWSITSTLVKSPYPKLPDSHQAHVFLLLVSPDLLASDYCTDVEIARALARHATKDAEIIPVLVRHCVWEWAPFKDLQALPRDGRPVKAWPDQDEAWAGVARLRR